MLRRGLSPGCLIVSVAFLTAAGIFGTVWAGGEAANVDYTKVSPADLVKSTPKGQLVNPYKDTQADVVAEGGKLLLSYSCSGCHGGGGRRGHVSAADQRHVGVRRRR